MADWVVGLLVFLLMAVIVVCSALLGIGLAERDFNPRPRKGKEV
jgi:hypothetical protein